MTKKDLLEAIKDMPMDAEIRIPIGGYCRSTSDIEVACDEIDNEIVLRY